MANRKNIFRMLIETVFPVVALFAFSTCLSAETTQAVKKDTPTTRDNLMAAYSGESNAYARYLAFAEQADKEGYGSVSSLFRAAARAEQVHFEHHAKIIKELGGVPAANIETPVVKTTRENIEAAFKGETYEKDTMYPQFLVQAKKEKVSGAIDAFEDASMAEAVHAALYKKVLDNLDAWKGAKKELYVCPVCGNVVEAPIGRCPICMVPGSKFIAVS